MKNFSFKMFTLILLLSFSILAQNIKSDEDSTIRPNKEPIPILVLFEFGVWTAVSGTDMPDFVLYDDGRVIYHGKNGYVTAMLAADEINQIMEKINALEFESYQELYTNCDKCYVSDLPSPFIMLRRKDGTYKEVRIHGLLNEKAPPEAQVVNIPKSLADAYKFLWSYETPKATVWRTDFIEVIVWKYDGESKKSVKWNKKLPDLNDSRTVPFKKSDTQYYSIFVPESLEKPLALTFYKLRKSKGALLLNNQRWHLTYRFILPSERVWLRGDDGKIFRDEK